MRVAEDGGALAAQVIGAGLDLLDRPHDTGQMDAEDVGESTVPRTNGWYCTGDGVLDGPMGVPPKAAAWL